MNEQELRSKGWRKQSDGSWSRSKRSDSAVGAVETSATKPITSAPLVANHQNKKGGKSGLGARISLIIFRKKRSDPDAIASSCKFLVDIIAETIGVDDGDPWVGYEWSEVQTGGEEGVMVKIEIL